MRTEQTKQILQRTELFRHLNHDALDKLAARAVKRTYRKGQLIFQQGEEARSLFLLLDGMVKLYVTSPDGDQMLLVTLGPGDVFGELALLDEGFRSASAETIKPCELLELGRGPFLDVLEDDPTMMRTLLASLGAVLRRLTDQAGDLVFLDLQGRVAKLLINQLHASAQGQPMELDLELTQSDLAAMVGGSRQSVNQALKALERRGFIAMSGRKIVVTDPDRLSRRAGL